MSDESIEKEIEGVIGGLFNAFEREAIDENRVWVQEVLTANKHLDINKPELFNLLASISLERKKRALLHQVTSKISISSMNKSKLEFAYSKYSFIATHLRHIIDKYEGYGCVTDKTRWLIDTYVEYLLTDSVPEITEKKYWHTDAGSVMEWMEYITSIMQMYYGDSDTYIECKNILSSQYGSGTK